MCVLCARCYFSVVCLRLRVCCFWNVSKTESKYYMSVLYRVVRLLCVVNLRMVLRDVF
jgi:hypothetical protein